MTTEREINHGPADPEPTPVCATCGSDDVQVDPRWCNKCEAWCDLTTEDEYLATHPEDVAARTLLSEEKPPAKPTRTVLCFEGEEHELHPVADALSKTGGEEA